MSGYDDLADDIHRAWREIRRTAHPSRRGELTPEQLWLLSHLRDHGPLSVGALARVLGVTQSAATTSCQRLEAAGLVTRSRDDPDERIVRVGITEAGSGRVNAWQQSQRVAIAPLLAEMSPQETDELRRLLRKLISVTGDRPAIMAVFWSITNLAESLV